MTSMATELLSLLTGLATTRATRTGLQTAKVQKSAISCMLKLEISKASGLTLTSGLWTIRTVLSLFDSYVSIRWILLCVEFRRTVLP